MSLNYRAAVLHKMGAPPWPLSKCRALTRRLRMLQAAGLCHTDLEAIDGSLHYPLPIILGHEASGIIEHVGSAVTNVQVGAHVILSWNPHCGRCFHCNRGQPILCETDRSEGTKGLHFDSLSKAALIDGEALSHLMFLGVR